MVVKCGVEELELSAQGSDLNPIEHLWKWNTILARPSDLTTMPYLTSASVVKYISTNVFNTLVKSLVQKVYMC